MDMHLPHELLRQPLLAPRREGPEGLEFPISSQLHAHFDENANVMWLRWNPQPRPCFNPRLLSDLRTYCDFVTRSEARIRCRGDDYPLEYTVLASDSPGAFNLGGDLDLFQQLIANRDRAGLLLYGRACIDVLYRNYVAYDLPLTTISLVQGDCLGGGFEAALSSDLVVAEKGARFGFPEILFNLFPGMGAYSFLERRVGQKITEELLTSGRIYSADEMLSLGMVDAVAQDGEGEARVAALIKSRARSRNGLSALAMARRRVHRIDFAELMDIVEIWVDSALRLNPRDLKLMQRLVSKQNGLFDSQQVH
jgi:DSF synthase